VFHGGQHAQTRPCDASNGKPPSQLTGLSLTDISELERCAGD